MYALLIVYALVDGDPYGYEIFTCYKYGSVAMAWCAEVLTVPKLKWLGVKPSEFEYMPDHHKRPLTVADQAKLDSLNERGLFSPEHGEELLCAQWQSTFAPGCFCVRTFKELRRPSGGRRTCWTSR